MKVNTQELKNAGDQMDIFAKQFGISRTDTMYLIQHNDLLLVTIDWLRLIMEVLKISSLEEVIDGKPLPTSL